MKESNSSGLCFKQLISFAFAKHEFLAYKHHIRITYKK